MGQSKKKRLWWLYVARDKRQQHPKYSDELERYGRLHVFYDTPELENGKWGCARQLGGEIPAYMFPDLEEGHCQKFIGIIGDLDNKMSEIVEFLNNTDNI